MAVDSSASFNGLASGVQWRDPADQISAGESVPVDTLQTKIDAARLRTAAWGDFQNKVRTLKDAATALTDDGLRGKTVNVSAPSILAATVTEDASPGLHSVRVLRLASAEILGSDLFASRTTGLGLTGELRVAGAQVMIQAGDSLDDVARHFNDASAMTGVTASVLTTGSATYRLILATRNTGAEGIDLVDGSAGVLRSLGLLDATVTLKHDTTSGARSDLFSDEVTAVGTLLGFTSTGPETVDIGGVGVTLDLSTMSLDDIVAEINNAATAAGRAVTAAVIDDGTGKRLDIRNTTSFTDSGRALEALGILAGGRGSEARAIESELLEAGAGTLDFGTFGVTAAGRSRQITAGADAEFEIDGTCLTQVTNTVTDVVPGLTLRLGAADPSTTVVVSVASDSEAMVTSIKALIDACNDLAGFADSQLRPPPEGQTPAPLYNDGSLRTMRSPMRAILGSILNATLTGGIARLTDIGIEIDRHGRYTVDDTKLQAAVDNRSESVIRLFGLHGTTTATGLTYLSATDKTIPGSYAVDVTQVATFADVTGAGFGGTYVDDGTADSMSVRDVLRGHTYTVSLKNGMSMSQIVAALNTEFAMPRRHVMVAGNALTDGAGAFANDATAWTDVNLPPGTNAGIATGDVITISGTRTDGSAFARAIPVGAGGTLGELRAAAQAAACPDVEVCWDNGVLSARTRTPGSKVFTFDVRTDNAGGGTLDFGGFTATQQGRGTSGITAEDVGDQLRLFHDEYGSAAGFDISFLAGGADGSASLGLAAGNYVGADVAGTIGGFAAHGAGRLLTGTTGTAVEGLIVSWAGATTGAVGSVTFSRGIGSRLALLGDEYLGKTAGSIEALADRIESSIARVQERVDALENRLDMRRAALIERFTALEQAISLAQSQGAWLRVAREPTAIPMRTMMMHGAEVPMPNVDGAAAYREAGVLGRTPAHPMADACSRYAALITSQLEALDRDAVEDVGLLGSQREQLAAEIDALEFDGLDPEALDEVRRPLAACIDADTRLRERLEQMRRENVVGTRRVDRWRKALSTYSRGMPGAAEIDVKF